MRQTIKLVLIVLCVSQVLSQCTVSNPGPITLDQGTAVVCLHVNLNGTYSKTYAFKLNVDNFQALVVNGFANYINTQIKAGITEVSVDVQFQNTNNSQIQEIQIYNKTGQRYRDILSFIIIANGGSFAQISLDNESCDNLGSGYVCYQNEGFTSTPSDGTYGGSDPRFFVTWMGTDVNNNHFISQSMRLSRYSSFSVGSIYNDAKNVISA